jgi:hypothetical protein
VLLLRRAEAGSPPSRLPGARGFHCGQDAFRLSFGTAGIYGKLLVLILGVW